MIINNQYQFIYIHVAKTAGTAVSTALQRYAGPADIDLGGAVVEMKGDQGRYQIAKNLNTLWPKQWGIEKHSPVARIRQKVGPRIWPNYFKFAFVRNPFARTYSGFKFAKKHKSAGGALEEMSFSEFLRSEWFQDLKLLPIQSQAAFLHPISQVDFIGRQENLSDDLKLAASIIERRRVTEIDIPDLNRSASPDEWRDMSDVDRDIIRDILARDFEELGYSPEDGSVIGA
ncbi:MAG: sulfotransferase family 2 domain-containing protein [Pseudomonadota bacterium]